MSQYLGWINNSNPTRHMSAGIKHALGHDLKASLLIIFSAHLSDYHNGLSFRDQ
jgi:hypothetical protein